MHLLFTLDGVSEFKAGVHIDTGPWHRVTNRALDLAATEVAEGGHWDQVTELVVAAGGRATEFRLLTPGEISAVWDATLAILADRREAAVARRRVEAAGPADPDRAAVTDISKH